jgi:hypothetical protein
MQDASTSQDPARVLQEAAAEYVGGRVETYFNAVHALASASARGTLTAQGIASIAKEYDSGMAVRIYGYEERCGLFRTATEVQSAAPIPERLCQYLETRILAGRFAEYFADDPALTAFAPSA